MGTTGREAVRPPGRRHAAAAASSRPAGLTGVAAAVEDLAREALAAAWRSGDRIGGYDTPGARACRVVANRAVSGVRRSCASPPARTHRRARARGRPVPG